MCDQLGGGDQDGTVAEAAGGKNVIIAITWWHTGRYVP